jgi:hypothetical protein
LLYYTNQRFESTKWLYQRKYFTVIQRTEIVIHSNAQKKIVCKVNAKSSSEVGTGNSKTINSQKLDNRHPITINQKKTIDTRHTTISTRHKDAKKIFCPGSTIKMQKSSFFLFSRKIK